MQKRVDVSIRLSELGIDTENDYLLDQIETEVHSEANAHELIFFVEFTSELAVVANDIEGILELVDIEENKEIEFREKDPLERIGDFHLWHSQNSI